MPSRHAIEPPLSRELDAIAAAAADRLRAHVVDNPATAREHGQMSYAW
ncbi:MAG: hypothetical protein WAL38_10500 [Solirubrobacteraceae bacterium]